MGKKKVLKQTEEQLLKETGERESAATKSAAPAGVRRFVKSGRAYVQATYNNTLLTLTDEKGNVLAWASSGGLGFKGAKKSTPFAATKVVETVLEKVKKSGLENVAVFVRGIGSGRESAVRALAANLNVTAISDITPIPHNGCRPPKVRRV
ncbi:MAG: 30S ribosomal protein S11 [Patescibacteria group bacterium]